MTLALRQATPDDRDRTFRWANDPDTRSASFRSAPIEPAEHERWFSASLSDPGRTVLIAELGGAAIGVVRFHALDPRTAELSLALAPERRGQGLAVPVLQAALEHAAALGFSRLLARIRPSNERSLRSFVRAGFRHAGVDVVAGQAAVRYEWLAPRSPGG